MSDEAFYAYVRKEARLAKYGLPGIDIQEESHPSGSELYDFASGWLHEGDRVRVEGHVHDCAFCAREVSRIAEVEESLTLSRLAWADTIPQQEKIETKESVVERIWKKVRPGAHGERRFRGRPALAFGVLACILAVVTGIVLVQDRHWKAGFLGTKESDQRISVLFFEGVGDDATYGYCATGLTEHVVSRLARIRDLTVTPFLAVSRMDREGLEYGEIAERLGSRFILDGSMTRSIGLLHVTARLIDALTGEPVWEERFELGEDLSGIFGVQKDIVQRVVTALRVSLSGEERRVIEKDPTDLVDAYACYMRGRDLYWKVNKEDNEKAIAWFEKSIDLDPDYALAYAGLARCYEHLFDRGWDPDLKWIERALTLCDKALALDPDLPEAYHAKAIVLMNGKMDYMGAALADTEAIALCPSYHAAYHTRSIALFRLCRYGHAIADLTRCLSIDPTYAEAVRDLGRIHERMEDYEKAVAFGEKALAMGPDVALNLLFLGRFYTKAGMWDEADVLFREGISRWPDNFWFHDFHAQFYMAQGRYEVAARLYRKIFEMVPDNPHALSNGANFCNLIGDHEQAWELLTRALSQTQDDPEAQIHRCSTLFSTGELDSAMECAERLVEDFPGNVQASLVKGQVLLARGDIEAAQKLSQGMVARFPEDPVALDFRGRILLLTGQVEAVEAYAQDMIGRLPASPRGYNLLAAVLMHLGRSDEAARAQAQALVVAPDDPETLHNAATVFEAAGRIDEKNGLTERLRAMDLDALIDKPRLGEREDKLFWLQEGMGLYP